MGSEANPAGFVDALLDVIEELGRVLAPHGSICVELGDTYSGSGGAGGDYDVDGLRAGQERFDGSARRGRQRVTLADGHTIQGNGIGNGAPRQGAGWPLDKSLCMIPESVRWALTYGHNPFNRRSTPRWRVRNVVRHFRPNPPVGALGDKVRPATSDWLVACKSRDRYFDLDDPALPPNPPGLSDPNQPAQTTRTRTARTDTDTDTPRQPQPVPHTPPQLLYTIRPTKELTMSSSEPFEAVNLDDTAGNPAGGFVDGLGLHISWQNGPLNVGGNRRAPTGAFVETVIRAALQRLEYYNSGRFRCRENSLAITHLEEALHWLDHRTRSRVARGVEGTHQP